MPGTTPNRGYPFPLDNDQIDVAGDMERLARAVDADGGSADSRLDAIEGLNAQQDARLAGVEGKNATQDGQLAWLRARTQGLTIGGLVQIVTNENGDFTYDFPVGSFPAGTGTAVVANISDGNIAAFIIIIFSNSVGFNGRIFSHDGSHTGPTAGLTVSITYQAFGFMNAGYP